jgi:predicted nucleic acid-binding protein
LVAHFRKPNPALQTLLSADQVLCHPMVLIEIACGSPPAPRERTLGYLRQLRYLVATSTMAQPKSVNFQCSGLMTFNTSRNATA